MLFKEGEKEKEKMFEREFEQMKLNKNPLNK